MAFRGQSLQGISSSRRDYSRPWSAPFNSQQCDLRLVREWKLVESRLGLHGDLRSQLRKRRFDKAPGKRRPSQTLQLAQGPGLLSKCEMSVPAHRRLLIHIQGVGIPIARTLGMSRPSLCINILFDVDNDQIAQLLCFSEY